MRALFIYLLVFFTVFYSHSQLVINEGCNKNYQNILDENNDSPDWIEIYNNSNTQINLNNYFLTDNISESQKWVLPSITLNPYSFKLVFCSGKDRNETPGFNFCLSEPNFTPTNGWNNHILNNQFTWDGVSNVILNICSYNNSQYTLNSVFKQTPTSYPSTLAAFIDGSPAACSTNIGQLYNLRPNVKINGITIGSGNQQNSNTDYPAPYGNYYWGARHQILFRASELIAAGITPGTFNSIAFEVAESSGEFYNYIDFSFKSTTLSQLTNEFLPENGYQLHSNFKIDAGGEVVYLYDSNNQIVSSLNVKSPTTNISVGHYTDGSNQLKWMNPSPNASNNLASVFSDTLKSPVFSKYSSVNTSGFQLSIENPNSIPSKIVYTLDGTIPTFNSTVYTNPISITTTRVVHAKIFPLTSNEYLPSENTFATYLFNASHTTPILLVTTDNSNLYGSTGIFDNFTSDDLKPAFAAYLSETENHPLLFSRKTAMRMDGGAGGSRSKPQHSFRLSFDNGALGGGSVNTELIPTRPNRNKYSDIYLRNGSNQHLVLPYKDACQVYMMSQGTDNYYSGYRPISVYINGNYFGLYELREKFNTEYFDTYNNKPIKDSIEILSLSYYYNSILRAVEGNVENFWNSYNQFLTISPTSNTFINQADQYFDMKHYTDYIISESWMGNTDWPHNNIKIYRSDQSNYRWRFALIDLELSLQPNGWSNCNDNHINFMKSRSPEIPYINIWLRGIQNEAYRNYFINRFADQMNSSYLIDSLIAIEQQFYDGMFPEMPKQFARWGNQNSIASQMQVFTNNHLTFKSQLICRNNTLRNHLISEFNLVKKVNVKLDVFPENTGSIKINTLSPQVFPWTGVYFDGVPIQISAHEKPGFLFSHWEPNNFISDTLNPIINENITSLNTEFKAHFIKIPDGPDIHFTIYPNPSSDFISIRHDNETVSKECSFEIFDLNGRIILKSKLDEDDFTTTININHFRSSIYFVRFLKNDELLIVEKIIKQ